MTIVEARNFAVVVVVVDLKILPKNKTNKT
jgi:hypothetical protein